MSACRISLADYDGAEAYARESLVISSELHSSTHVARSLQRLATVAALRAQSAHEPRAEPYARAARLFGFVDACLAALGSRRDTLHDRQEYERAMAVLRSAMSSDQLASLMNEGAAMSEEQAIDEALADCHLIPRSIAIWAFACVLAACAKAGAPPSRPATLVIAVAQEPASLNPLYLQGSIGYAISELGYTYLTNYDSLGNIVPDVAVTVPSRANGGISIDGKRVVYHLRRDVSWQDGAPLNSHDVAFTYRAIMNPSNAVPSRYGYDRVASVEAPDPYTVVVKLKRPYSPIIAYFFGGDSNYPILPAHLLAQYASLDRVSIQRGADRLGPLPLRALGTRRSVGDDGKSAITMPGDRPSLASVCASSTTRRRRSTSC